MIPIKMESGRGDLTPYRATSGAAGIDLHAAETKLLWSGQTRIISCGFSIAVPKGAEAQIRSRSGLAKKGLIVANAPGTIDSDYRGIVGVLLYNRSWRPHKIYFGMRIAQMVVSPIWAGELTAVPELPETERGSGGFGSTGVK